MSYPIAYQPVPQGSKPAGGPRSGTIALRDAVRHRFASLGDDGIYNPRDVCGHPYPNTSCALSLHFDGRAWDAATTLRSYGDLVAATVIAVAAELGVCEVIWWERRWTLAGGWRRYRGRSPHRDHVHLGQTIEAAHTLTRSDAARALETAVVDHPPGGAVLIPRQFDPPLQIIGIAERAAGGAWLLGDDGGVFAVGGAPFHGSPVGQPYWAGRRAATINVDGAGYVIEDTDGETYHYP